MKGPKDPLVIGLLITGLILVVVSLFFSIRNPREPDPNSRLARLERESGAVFVIHSGYTQKEKVLKTASLYNLDSIVTSEAGEATVTFESAFRLKVNDDSIVTLEKMDEGPKSYVNLIIKKGDVRIENFGREGELFIAKNGERVSATDYSGSQLNTAVVTTTPTIRGPAPIGLSEEEISGVMSGHGGFFKKCFTQLLQKDAKAQGEVTLSFTIENNGKLSVSEFTSATLNQAEFKKCILDVISRIEFKPFTGPPISTLFPLKFE